MLLIGSLLLRVYFIPVPVEQDIPIFERYIALMRSTPIAQLLSQNFTKLSTGYIYLWLPLTYLPVSAIYIVKGCSVAFDYICAYWCFRLIRLQNPKAQFRPWAGALIMLYTPVLVMNASIWAQLDSTYTAFLMAGIYYVMRLHTPQAGPRDRRLSMICFSMAIAFKVQGLFMLPAFCFFFVSRIFPWRYALIPLAVYVAFYVPRVVLGLPLESIFAGYHRQINTLDYYHYFSFYGANLQDFFMLDMDSSLYAGIGLGALLCFVGIYSGRKFRNGRKVPEDILLLCAASLICCAFVLPRMMPRYYMPANLISVVLAFYHPVGWIVAILVNTALAVCYMPYLLYSPPQPIFISQPHVAIVASIAVFINSYALWERLRLPVVRTP